MTRVNSKRNFKRLEEKKAYNEGGVWWESRMI